MDTPSPRRSLSSRLSLSVGLSSAVLSLVVLGLVAGMFILRSAAHMDEQGRRSAAFLAESLEYPIWTLDLDAVTTIGQALAQDRVVGLVEVGGVGGEIYYAYRTQDRIVQERRRDVVHEGKAVGWVRVGLNDMELQATLWPVLLTGVGLAGLIILLQYLLHARYVRPLLAGPFASLDRLVAAYSAGDFSATPPRAPYAEFAPLFRLLADMGGTIQRQMDALKASEERLSLALEAANDGLWDWNVATGKAYFSPRYYTMLGYAPGDFAGSYAEWRSRIHPDDLARVEERLSGYLAGALPTYEAEFRMLDTAGRWRWILARGKVAERDAAGAARRFVGTHVDLTARKELELRLADQLAFQQALMDTIPYAVFYKGADTRFLGFNSAYEETFGVRREDLLGKRVLDLEYLPGADRLAYQAEDEAVIASVGRVQKEMPIPFADGRVHQTLYSVSGFCQADGSPGGLIGVIVDITERKEAVAALAASETRYRTLFEVAQDTILVVRDGRIMDCNRSAETLLGRPRLDIIGRSPAELSPPRQPDGRDSFQVQEQVHADTVSGKRLLFDWTFVRPDGVLVAVEVALQAIGGDEPGRLMGMVRDVTERRRAEQLLRQSEEKFSLLFMLSPYNIALSELDTGRFVEVNESFLRFHGLTREQAIGRTVAELGIYVDINQRKAVVEALTAEGRVVNFEITIRRGDGSLRIGSLSARIVEIGGRPLMMSILSDITEIKKMQEVMVQTEKMISVGGIAAGVAHEINNPLGIILQACQNLERRTSPGLPRNAAVARDLGLEMEQLQRYMQERKVDVFIKDIKSAAVRASAIIRHMLDFSRRSEAKRGACDLPGIVRKAVDLAQSDYDLKMSYDFKQIRVDLEVADGLPAVQCTETDLEQVLLNLLRNAAQAMAGAEPPVAEPRIAVRLTARPGGVRIAVEDNGPGIPPEVQRRIFEPFFTTKPPGVGTGLGLSVSYFIVTKGHGGAMRVESTPGYGTMFIIDLPTEEARA